MSSPTQPLGDLLGSVVIDCSRCQASTRTTTSDAIRRLVSLSLWIPGRSYNRRLRCPACHRRAWVRVRWELAKTQR